MNLEQYIEDERIVHADGLNGEYTLCGITTTGDEELNISNCILTKDEITCKDCIEIIEHCKKL